MNKYIFLIFMLLLILNSSCAQSIESISVKDPIRDSTLVIYSNTGYAAPTYIQNKNYIVFQKNETERFILKNADAASFRYPKYNPNWLFALDKNGVYFSGDFIATDTTGFKHVAQISSTNSNTMPDFVWKTKDKLFKNNIEIKEDIDIESFSSTTYGTTQYFKDKNYLYYNFKRVKNADINSLSESPDNLIYDKNYVYIDGKIGMHNGDTLYSVNDVLMKTSKEVLTVKERKVIPYIDVKTLKGLSRYYSVDKNFAYIGAQKTVVTVKDAKEIKVWDQVNSTYISDGKNVYIGGGSKKLDLDAKSFGMVPSSDYYFDKNGIYGREWNEKELKSNLIKFPFNYTKEVTLKNTFVDGSYIYLIYDNQAYNRNDHKIYKNLTPSQIDILKDKTIKNADLGNLDSTGKIDTKKIYAYKLYKFDNKIFANGKETTADAATFEKVQDFYKDKNNLYTYDDNKELIAVKGYDVKTVKPFYNFLADKNYIYYKHYKLIKNKNPEILAILKGYIPGCGLDRNPASNYYLLKNDEGYWLALISNVVSIKFLGNKSLNNNGNIDHLYTPPPPTTPESLALADNTIYNNAMVDTKAEYKGGISAYTEFVKKNFKAPSDESGKKIIGKVYLTYIIEKDGSITNAKVLRDYGYHSGKEALRVLSTMPKWIPAKLDGKPVRVLMSFPMTTPLD